MLLIYYLYSSISDEGISLLYSLFKIILKWLFLYFISMLFLHSDNIYCTDLLCYVKCSSTPSGKGCSANKTDESLFDDVISSSSLILSLHSFIVKNTLFIWEIDWGSTELISL